MTAFSISSLGNCHKISKHCLLILAMCFVIATIGNPSSAKAASKAATASEPITQVYFIRGFMGIFSTGFDAMAEKLTKSKVRAEVVGHLSGSTVRAKIVKQWAQQKKRHKPIVIVGHSFGGNAAFQVAAQLAKENIPVALVVTLDPTRAGPVSKNVRSYVNYFFPGNGLGTKLKARGKISTSRIKNIDMRKRQESAGTHDGHWTVTNNNALQSEILKAIKRAAR